MLKWAAFVSALLGCTWARYENNWASLDKRPIPSWYDEGKFGIYLHWGVFSVPSFSNEWFWEQWRGPNTRSNVVDYMKKNYRPDFTYPDFASQFTADLFKPEEFANLFKAAGAKYLVMVTKHHEGFANWPSKYAFNWNSMDVGPKRDLVGEVAAAIRNLTDIKFGMYHSFLEWYHPWYLDDLKNNLRTNNFPIKKVLPEMYELVNNYKPEIFWSDGDWLQPDWYWNSTNFVQWLYNDSPVKDTVVVNDRWGNNTRCKHGGFWDCNDRFLPDKLMGHKWEDGESVDRYSFGFRREASVDQLYSIEKLIFLLVKTVSLGGNFLLNIGVTHYGRITPIYEERLLQIGQWLNVNGEAIYSSKIWAHQNDSLNPDVWYTAKKSATGLDVYAILLKWPTNHQVVLGAPKPSSGTTITLLGYTGQFQYTPNPAGGIIIKLPPIPYSLMPCHWGWAFKMTGLVN